ncbi:methyltransferase family protein [Ensifer sp. P24N7]|uniref:methyltransferase family protein n=1 Tax=Sinorhizobium sp. P24N7 TaxID=3348358 RepID=UPI0035F4856F
MDPGYEQWIRLWPYAVLLIVVGAWAIYHFLAPSSWREWAGAGVVQAFIIALYAEMYGFPLTIYFLTSFLPIDIPLVHSSGHLWATLLGYGRGGAVVEMLIGSVFIAAGLLLIIKGWVRIYFRRHDLVTDGVYGLVRHPQYTGIFLVVLGQLIHWPTVFTLALAPVIVWLYVRLARREEALLIEQFGEEYRKYRQRVPMFIPHWPRADQAEPGSRIR